MYFMRPSQIPGLLKEDLEEQDDVVPKFRIPQTSSRGSSIKGEGGSSSKNFRDITIFYLGGLNKLIKRSEDKILQNIRD